MSDQRPDRHDLGVLDLEVDRHGLFQLGVGPAAGAEAVRPAQHHQPAAQLLGVAHEHADLLVGEAADVVGVLAAGRGTSARITVS